MAVRKGVEKGCRLRSLNRGKRILREGVPLAGVVVVACGTVIRVGVDGVPVTGTTAVALLVGVVGDRADAKVGAGSDGGNTGFCLIVIDTLFSWGLALREFALKSSFLCLVCRYLHTR